MPIALSLTPQPHSLATYSTAQTQKDAGKGLQPDLQKTLDRISKHGCRKRLQGALVLQLVKSEVFRSKSRYIRYNNILFFFFHFLLLRKGLTL